jgi:hypothetical protein
MKALGGLIVSVLFVLAVIYVMIRLLRWLTS